MSKTAVSAVFLLLVLAVYPTVQADSYCVNDTYRAWSTEFSFNNTFYRINQSAEQCQYGCAGGECLPSKEGENVALAVIFIGIIFAFAYLGVNMGQQEKSALIGWMFIILSLVFMVSAIYSLVSQSIYYHLLNQLLATISYAIILVIIIVIAYIMIFMLFGLLRKIMPYGDKTKDKYS